ncbi:MAG TPA: SDR family oxidoreductase [Xanthomonadaceae bacterium]|nr:SDR family oxidoreductase [Xanthomonadaceae bacterium]
MPDTDLPEQPASIPAARPSPGHALITGASSGIGAAIAREYARRGKPLILTARREDRLTALADELGKHVPCFVIAADLADPSVPEALFIEIQEHGLFVDTLVNNAGYGVPGRFLSSDWATHAAFMQVLMTGVVELSHRFLPAMETAGRGRILNVASLAGLIPSSAGHTLYGASKAFVIRFSESLAQEMKPKGVHVTALCPGFTYTEFHDVNGMRTKVSKLPRFLWLTAEQVARIGVDAVEAGKSRVVTGKANRAIAAISKYMPEAVARKLVSRHSKDFRDAD